MHNIGPIELCDFLMKVKTTTKIKVDGRKEILELKYDKDKDIAYIHTVQRNE